MAQVVLRVVQEVVPEEVVQAWEVLVSEKEPIAGELAAVQQQMSHQKETLPYAVSVMAFLLQNRQNHHHHHPLKIPLLLVPPEGFPDLPFEASWLEEESAPSCFSFSSLIFQAYLQTVHSNLTFFLHWCLSHHPGAQSHPLHFLHLIGQCHYHQCYHHAYLDPCPQDSRHPHWYWTHRHHGPAEQAQDYTACPHLVSEEEDQGRSQLYGHTSVRLEEVVAPEEDQEVFCLEATVEHHVQEEEV